MTNSKNILDPSKKELRSFGLMMGAIMSIFGFFFTYKGIYEASAVLGAGAFIFFGLGLAVPKLLAGAYHRWMKFAGVLGEFNLKIILGLIYLTAFTFVRLVFLITRKDPMCRKLDVNAKTYWMDHQELGKDPRRYEKLF